MAFAWVALLERDCTQKALQGWVFEERIRGHLLSGQQLWTEDEFQSWRRSLLTLWNGKVMRGTNKITPMVFFLKKGKKHSYIYHFCNRHREAVKMWHSEWKNAPFLKEQVCWLAQVGWRDQKKVVDVWRTEDNWRKNSPRAEGSKEDAKPICASKAAVPVVLCVNTSLNSSSYLIPSTCVSKPSLYL